jgi:hypothetical protein
MISKSLGASALKIGAVLGALAAVPPLLLDDRATPEAPWLMGGMALSAILTVAAIALLRHGSREATEQLRLRYRLLTSAFVFLAAILYAIELLHR